MTLKKLDDSKYSTATRLVHGKSLAQEWDYSHHVVPPITTSTTFRLDSVERGAAGFKALSEDPVDPDLPPIYIYDRIGEPNNDMLESRLAVAEGGETAVTFATGMAAILAAVSFALNPDSEIVANRTIYGCTYSLFASWFNHYGIKTTFVDLNNEEEFRKSIKEQTRVVFLESPCNPSLELLDLNKICSIVKEINKDREESRKILTVMDNTLATPFCQRPLSFGIDLVVHSMTKAISGFGTDMGGCIVTRKSFRKPLILFRKDFGSSLSSRVAWHILAYGLPTLSLRMSKQQENAIQVAEFLEAHSATELVSYPGLVSFKDVDLAKTQMRDYKGEFAPGSMIYFVLKGESPEDVKERGRKMMNYIADNSYTITLAVSLGQLRTLIEHPGSMTHAAYPAELQLENGINPGGIRLSIGIEEVDDIISDLDQALKNIE